MDFLLFIYKEPPTKKSGEGGERSGRRRMESQAFFFLLIFFFKKKHLSLKLNQTSNASVVLFLLLSVLTRFIT